MNMQQQVNFIHAYGTSEGVKKAWDVRGRTGREVASKLGLPSGKGQQKWGDDYQWNKKGGHYDMSKVHDKLTKAGFVKQERNSEIGQPETVRHGTSYSHPSGHTAHVSQSYGGTSYDNWHSISLKAPKEEVKAAANPFPLKASFHQVNNRLKCKLCGARVKSQKEGIDHLFEKHRQMASCSDGKKMYAGGPGSGRHKESFNEGARVARRQEEVLHGFEHDDALRVRAKQHAQYSGGHAKSFFDGYKSVQNKSQYSSGRVGPVVKPISKKHFSGSGIEARDFSEKRRKKLAKSGDAMPGGGFPIVNRQDLSNARQAIGRAKNPSAARAHIRERAKDLGVKLPSKWKKGVKAEQFSPADRLRMPPAAGTTQRTVSPPGIHIQAQALIRQRPGGPRRKVGSVVRGSQVIV